MIIPKEPKRKTLPLYSAIIPICSLILGCPSAQINKNHIEAYDGKTEVLHNGEKKELTREELTNGLDEAIKAYQTEKADHESIEAQIASIARENATPEQKAAKLRQLSEAEIASGLKVTDLQQQAVAYATSYVNLATEQIGTFDSTRNSWTKGSTIYILASDLETTIDTSNTFNGPESRDIGAWYRSILDERVKIVSRWSKSQRQKAKAYLGFAIEAIEQVKKSVKQESSKLPNVDVDLGLIVPNTFAEFEADVNSNLSKLRELSGFLNPTKPKAPEESGYPESGYPKAPGSDE